jgi:hypothetical protein
VNQVYEYCEYADFGLVSLRKCNEVLKSEEDRCRRKKMGVGESGKRARRSKMRSGRAW